MPGELSKMEATDVVFVIEVTTNFKPYFKEMKDAYIQAIVEYVVFLFIFYLLLYIKKVFAEKRNMWIQYRNNCFYLSTDISMMDQS